MFFKVKPSPPPPAEISGVRIRPSKRARRISLRLDARTGEVVLVLPPRASQGYALRFIEKHRDWIERQRARKPAAAATGPGSTLAILGRDYVVTHAPGRGATRIEGDRLIVHGDVAHLPRRLRDFLKKEAERILTEAAREKTARLGLKMHPVRIRDPKTRWGSCGRDGRLMFSWRLLLAPESVLDYIVAHEVAHRVHMNHRKKFWALCAELTESDVAASRRWLRTHGQALISVL
jgi:predicted metal-dependent hydrolase